MNKQIIEEIKLFIEQDNIDAAKDYLEKYESDCENFKMELYSIKSIIYIKENQLNKAEGFIKKGLEIDPINTDLIYNLAYLKFLQGDIETAYRYYLDCYINSKDKDLKQEVISILEQLQFSIDKNKLGFITIWIGKYVGNIRDIRNEKSSIYKMNLDVFYELMKENFIQNIFLYIIFDEFIYISELKALNIYGKLIYNCNKNLYLDKVDYLNKTSNIYNEMVCCNESDIIITDNIKIYITKKFLENNEKIYFIKETNFINYHEMLINLLLFIYDSRNNLFEDAYDKYFYKSDCGYIKTLYNIIKKQEKTEEDVVCVKEIYKKNNDELVFIIYIKLLLKFEKINECIEIIEKSHYVKDVFVDELRFLNNLGNQELIKFMINLSLNNYSAIVNDIYLNDYYKLANLYYSLGYIDEAFENYKKILIYQDKLSNSIMVNKNLKFLRTKI
ncbi:MAG: tetratricopeptide repeat protein [Paraclostridium sordellii]